MRLIEKTPDRNQSAIELRKGLVLRIAARAESVGENPTAVPGLALYRRDVAHALQFMPLTSPAFLSSSRARSASASVETSTFATDLPSSFRPSTFLR